MPVTNGEKKIRLITTRLAPSIEKIVQGEARREGMDVSEWVRNIIVQELRGRGVLSHKITLGPLGNEERSR